MTRYSDAVIQVVLQHKAMKAELGSLLSSAANKNYKTK